MRGDKINSNFVAILKYCSYTSRFVQRWLEEKAEIISRQFIYNLNKSIVPTELKTYIILYYIHLVKLWCCWLRNCSESLNVADSIPDGVLGIIFIHIILGSTEPLTEMNTMKVSWDANETGAWG